MFNAKEEKERQEELSQVPAEVGRFQALGIPKHIASQPPVFPQSLSLLYMRPYLQASQNSKLLL